MNLVLLIALIPLLLLLDGLAAAAEAVVGSSVAAVDYAVERCLNLQLLLQWSLDCSE